MKKITKAILTGGGRATRLHPVTATINKHLLPLANKPMIFHAIEKVATAGIREVFINVNPGEKELERCVGDGGHWGVSIRYFEQTGGPLGLAHVVSEAEKFIGNDPFLFYLSDNILLGDIRPFISNFENGSYECMLAFSAVPDPERFGVPVFDADGQLTDIVEKPASPASPFAVTGMYLYGPGVFFPAFQHIEKSARGEYEISSIHSHLLKTGRRVGYTEVTGWWKDTGLPRDLLLANMRLLDLFSESERCHVGVGTHIGAHVELRSPVAIGENCILEDCIIGPYASIGSGSLIRGASVRDSILLERVSVTGSVRIEESVIGRGVSIERDALGATSSLTPPTVVKTILGDKTVLVLK